MLSYKYYKTPTAKEQRKFLEPLINLNDTIRKNINNTITELKNELVNPVREYNNRYNIWDQICDNINEIIGTSIFGLGTYDQIFFCKLMHQLRDSCNNINQVFEYYILIQIIKIPIFKFNKKLTYLAKNISNYLQTLHIRKRNLCILNRNLNKIRIIKKKLGILVILRCNWNDIYLCYNAGNKSVFDELNQCDIYDLLGIKNNTNDIVSTDEIEKELAFTTDNIETELINIDNININVSTEQITFNSDPLDMISNIKIENRDVLDVSGSQPNANQDFGSEIQELESVINSSDDAESTYSQDELIEDFETW